MRLYLKVIGCSCYTCLPQSSPAAAQRALKKVALGTPPMAQRLLMIETSKHGPHKHMHANKGKRQETVQQYNKTAHKTELKLFYALQQSRERETT
jgi:hypothetical protein